MAKDTVRLLIACPDARGIVAAVSGFLYEHGGNVLDADQHTDREHGEFFMRVEVERAGFDLDRERFEAAWAPVARRFLMRWQVHWSAPPKRMAILVSRQGHCLHDLLWRWRAGELEVELPLVISNHGELRGEVERCGVRFLHLPLTGGEKPRQEEAMLEALAAARIDFVVLARYMQVLSARFVSRLPERIINIHHSFLPAFAGKRPYHQAYDRGVKIIGATSHYVNEELDSGPIIAQATLPVGHRDSVADLVRKGRDLERIVLASAVRAHVEDKILTSRNRTVVFD